MAEFKKVLQRISCILALFIITSGFLLAQQQEVSVELTIPQEFLEDGDFPVLMGSFPGINSRDGVTLIRSESEPEVWRGSVQVTSRPEGYNYQYSIIRKNGVEEREWGNGRSYAVLTDGSFPEISDHIKGFGSVLNKSIEIIIRLDLSELHNEVDFIQAAGVSGGHSRGLFGELSWNFPNELMQMESTGEGQWTLTLQIPSGAPIDLPLKFAWKKDDIWDYEFLPYYQTHLLILDNESESFSVTYTYDPVQFKLVNTVANGMLVDDYQQASAQYSGSRNYHYHLAMELLRKGDISGADVAYQTFKKYYPELESGSYKDYYFTDKIEVALKDQPEVALGILDEKLAEGSDSRQQAVYHYLKGWTLMNAGRLEESRISLQAAMTLADDESAYHSQKQYARQVLARTYLMDPDPEQRLLARDILFIFSTTHTNEHLRRLGWEQLSSITRNDEDQVMHVLALQNLLENGSPRQRAKSKIKWVGYMVEFGEPDEATSMISELEEEFNIPYLSPDQSTDNTGAEIVQPQIVEDVNGDYILQEEIQLLRAKSLLRLEKKDEARSILEEIQMRQEEKNTSLGARVKVLLHNEAKASKKDKGDE